MRSLPPFFDFRAMKKAKSKSNNGNSADNSMLLKTSLPRPIFSLPGRPTRYSESIGPVYTIDLVSVPSTVTTGTGAIATVYSITSCASNVQNWSTRWAACFQEYRVVGVRTYVRVINLSVNQGVVVAWLDEKSSAAPTASQSLQARGTMIAGSTGTNNEGNQFEFQWQPHDINDLQFFSTGTTTANAWLKAYSDNANWGTGAAQTITLLFTNVYRVQFRCLV